jgi:hypothetical protein
MRLLEQKTKQGEITGLIMSVQKQQMKRIKHTEKLLKNDTPGTQKTYIRRKDNKRKRSTDRKRKPFSKDSLWK